MYLYPRIVLFQLTPHTHHGSSCPHAGDKSISHQISSTQLQRNFLTSGKLMCLSIILVFELSWQEDPSPGCQLLTKLYASQKSSFFLADKLNFSTQTFDDIYTLLTQPVRHNDFHRMT